MLPAFLFPLCHYSSFGFGLMCVVPPKPFGLFCLQLLPQSVTGHWSSRFHLLPASPPSRLQRWGSSFHHNKRSPGRDGAPYSILSEGVPVSSPSDVTFMISARVKCHCFRALLIVRTSHRKARRIADLQNVSWKGPKSQPAGPGARGEFTEAQLWVLVDRIWVHGDICKNQKNKGEENKPIRKEEAERKKKNKSEWCA